MVRALLSTPRQRHSAMTGTFRSLLYAGRFTYMPKGVMPATQGNPNRLNEDKIMFGISTSINVESEMKVPMIIVRD